MIIYIANQLNLGVHFFWLIFTLPCDLFLSLLLSSFFRLFYDNRWDETLRWNMWSLMWRLCITLSIFKFFQMLSKCLSRVIHSSCYSTLRVQSLSRYKGRQPRRPGIKSIIRSIIYITCKQTCIDALSSWSWTSPCFMMISSGLQSQISLAIFLLCNCNMTSIRTHRMSN